MTLYSINSHSAAFQEGEAAFHDEAEWGECPYEDATADSYNWQAGWEAAEADASMEHDDERLDDPRHGQARDLNAGRY